MRHIPELDKHGLAPAVLLLETLAIAYCAESMEKAGFVLEITKQAVNYRINRLEDRIGEDLFIRKAQPFALTDKGKEVIKEYLGADPDLVQ